MRASSNAAARGAGATTAALLGIGFFFAIIGVFGVPASIVALVLFVALAGLIFRRPQGEETRS
jgi:UPF0716 family protein affecting phage T7 exclusion